MTLYEETVSRSPWSGFWSMDGSQERIAAVIVMMSKTATTTHVIIIDLGIRSDSELCVWLLSGVHMQCVP